MRLSLSKGWFRILPLFLMIAMLRPCSGFPFLPMARRLFSTQEPRFGLCRLHTAKSNRRLTYRFASSTVSPSHDDKNLHSVGIVGGGLAGLSTAYHLLQKQPSIHVTILDVALPGEGGASAVAGGLLHPLSPRGKLVYMGLEGLESTNRLLQAAAKHEPKAVLREELYRVVVDDRQRQTLKATASRLVEWTTWLEEDDDDTVWQQLKQREDRLLGALRMYNGCKVVHVPTYLKGLWKACQEMGNEEAEWNLVPNDIGNVPDTWGERLKDFDCVVFAAGAGMFQSNVLNEKEGFPIQLVRGQSIEMTLPNYENDKAAGLDDHALLCGKYVSPLVEPNRILIGATHEFQTEPLAAASVEEELRGRSYDFASTIWDHGTIDRLTGGYRVQSKRGNHGRLPIVGRCASPYHDYAWIFTGLSSRGLLYHGVFGDCLADMILMNNDGEKKGNTKENVDWWRINS